MALLYKTLAVLIAGDIGAGKTIFGNMLRTEMKEHGWNVDVFPLAFPVKKVATIMGWDGKKDDRGRKLLQTIGADAGRVYDENMWVGKLVNETVPGTLGYPFDSIIVDDWRFENEELYIKSDPLYSVFTIRIFRPDTGGNGHISEKSLPTDPAWYNSAIYNTGDLYSLQRSAKATFEFLSESYNKGVK